MPVDCTGFAVRSVFFPPIVPVFVLYAAPENDVIDLERKTIDDIRGRLSGA
jgi:hypothetical protein